MSRRRISRDPVEERRQAYEALDSAEIQEALWEALTALKGNKSLGAKADAMLAKRETIRSRFPK